MKNIIAITAALNESDIIESYCRYTLSYCDALLIFEGGRSQDNTRDIIQKLICEGLSIHLLDNIELEGMKWNAQLARRAIEEYGADLIIAQDADEFLFHIDGINPRSALEACDENTEYRVPWRTYVYEEEPPPTAEFLPNRFPSYRNPLLETMHKTIASKRLFKNKRAKFAEGKHSLIYPDDIEAVKVVYDDKLLFAHYPLRSKTQVMLKVLEKGPRLIKLYPLPKGYNGNSFHYFRLWNRIKWAGKAEPEIIREQCVKYSVYPADLGRLLRQIGDDQLTIKGPLDTSFCADRLVMRYNPNPNLYEQMAKMLLPITRAYERKLPALQKEFERLIECERELEEIKASREYRLISRLSGALLPLGSRRRNFIKRLFKTKDRTE